MLLSKDKETKQKLPTVCKMPITWIYNIENKYDISNGL